MEFHRFIPVFASLLILFQLATPSDLPPPTISVTPAKLCYLIGDTVSIVCAAPPGTDNVVGFRFSGASQWVTDIRTSRRTFTHTFNVTGPRDGGAHRCSYAVHRHSPTHSPASQAVLINVRDRPNRPILMVTPSSVTVEGQPLVLLCTATPDDAERRFQFFQDDLEVTDGVQEGSGAPGSIQLRVDRSSRNWTGNFSCRYDEMTEGRWIQSYPSQAIQVIVKDPSPPPYLSVDPPSGVVVAGHRLQLSCTAPHRDFRRRFRFFRDGVEVIPSGGSTSDLTGDIGDITRDIGDGSELLFPRISQELAGNFSCRMEEEVGGAWLEAPPSQGVAVEVRGPLSQPVLLLSSPSATPDGSGPQISLTCFIPTPSGHAQRRFRFFHGHTQRLAEPTVSDHAQISVPTPSAATDGAGHFSCQYEEEVGGAWVLSPPSATVIIPDPAQFGLLPLVVGVVVGTAALLLGLLLAAWLCRRRMGASHWRGLRPGDDTGTFSMADVEVTA